MGANSNPPANQEGANGGGPSPVQGGGGPTANPINGTAATGGREGANLATLQALKHNPGLSSGWSAEEQAILDEGLSKYMSEIPPIRYAKIATQLQGKTVRDVALRCKWMNKKDSGKRRKDDHNLRKSKDKKERVSDSSAKPSPHLAARSTVPPYPPPMLPVDNDDDISYKEIGGRTGQLLENNDQIFKKISGNLSSLQIQENIALLYQARANLFAILNDMNDTPAVMNQMPPLPVKINEELASSILSRT